MPPIAGGPSNLPQLRQFKPHRRADPMSHIIGLPVGRTSIIFLVTFKTGFPRSQVAHFCRQRVITLAKIRQPGFLTTEPRRKTLTNDFRGRKSPRKSTACRIVAFHFPRSFPCPPCLCVHFCESCGLAYRQCLGSAIMHGLSEWGRRFRMLSGARRRYGRGTAGCWIPARSAGVI